MSLPWKLKPQYVKVEVDDATSFDVPLYPSQLVDEAILWAQLKKDRNIGTADAGKQYVIHSLRLRGVVDESVSDTDLSAQLTVDLTTKLFNLFFYGPSGEPEVIELDEEDVTAKKKLTGKKSSGSSSSTTPTSKSSTKKTLAAAQSA